MGIDIHLENADGGLIGEYQDSNGVFASLVHQYSESVSILKKIESDEAPRLNRSESIKLIVDLRSLRDNEGDIQIKCIANIIELATLCRRKPNTCLRFYKD